MKQQKPVEQKDDVVDMLIYHLAHDFRNGVCRKCGASETEQDEGEVCGRGTLAAIADACGVSQTAVTHWLHGRSMPTPNNVQALRAYFGEEIREERARINSC
jgi:hypothetical protein